jgi:hypothetical protein
VNQFILTIYTVQLTHNSPHSRLKTALVSRCSP